MVLIVDLQSALEIVHEMLILTGFRNLARVFSPDVRGVDCTTAEPGSPVEIVTYGL